MSLNDILKTAVIEDLKRVDINMLNDYARTNKSTLNFLYNQGTIDNFSIEKGLEHAVINQAKRDVRLMVANKIYTLHADHLWRPDCLAYALDKDKLSKKEIKQINFDHGETAKTFSKGHSTKNLLSYLRKELLNPKYPKLS